MQPTEKVKHQKDNNDGECASVVASEPSVDGPAVPPATGAVNTGNGTTAADEADDAEVRFQMAKLERMAMVGREAMGLEPYTNDRDNAVIALDEDQRWAQTTFSETG